MGSKNKITTFPREVFILLCNGDDFVKLIYIKNKLIKEEITEIKLELENSRIIDYIKKKPSVPIYLYLQENSIRVEKKSFAIKKFASDFISFHKKFKNTIGSFAKDISVSKSPAKEVLSIKLDSSVASRNSNLIVKFASFSKNKITRFNIFTYCIDCFLREKNNIDVNTMLISIILVKSGFIYTICSDKDSVIFSKCDKIDISLEKDTLNDIITNSFISCSKIGNQSYQKTGLFVTDLDSVIPFEPKNMIPIKISTDRSFFESKFKENGLIPHLMINASLTKEKNDLWNSNLSVKYFIFSIEKILRIIGIGLLLITGLIMANNFITPSNLGKKIEDAKVKLSDLKEKSNKMNINKAGNDFKKISSLVNVYNVYKEKEDWINEVSNVLDSFSNLNYVYPFEYAWSCGESCFLPDDQKEISLKITISNKGGYMHDMKNKIESISSALKKKFGDSYKISGIDFDDSQQYQQKYFRMNLILNLKSSNFKGGNSIFVDDNNKKNSDVVPVKDLQNNIATERAKSEFQKKIINNNSNYEDVK